MILDKLEKVGLEVVFSELTEQGLTPSTVQLIKQFLTDKNNTSYSYFEPFSVQNEQVKQGLEELKELETYLEFLGVNNQCIFNPFLKAREVWRSIRVLFMKFFYLDKTIKSSIGSGGDMTMLSVGLSEQMRTFLQLEYHLV